MTAGEFELGVEITGDGDEVTIHLAGDLDFFTVEPLRHAVRAAVSTHPQRVAIDLRDVTFVDLRGMDTLVEVAREGRQHGVEVVVDHPAPAIERLAHLLHVDEDDLLTD